MSFGSVLLFVFPITQRNRKRIILEVFLFLIIAFAERGKAMSWRMVMLTLRQAESGSGDQLLNELDEVFMEAGYPKEAAVFSRIDFVEKRCRYYFNPEATRLCSDLLLRWNGIECGDPGPGVVRVIGRR